MGWQDGINRDFAVASIRRDLSVIASGSRKFTWFNLLAPTFYVVFDLFLFYFAISIPPLSVELSNVGKRGRLPCAGEPRP